MKRSIAICLGLVGALALGLIVGRVDWTGAGRSRDLLVVERIQQIGSLRTVRHTQSQLVKAESHQSPSAPWSLAPGASQIVASLTRNEAWITAETQVEAGVDLSQVRVDPAPEEIVVTLPQATVYEPIIRPRLEASRAGWLWRDNAIALKAAGLAKEQAEAGAIQAGIEKQALEGAQTQLTALIGSFDARPIRFVLPKTQQS